MPLDPQVKQLLDQMEAAGRPPMSEQTPEEARLGMKMLVNFFGTPEKPAATEDRRIPGQAGEIPVRIYRPDEKGPHPVVVFFHGGGFVIGDIDTHDLICHNFASRVPCVVVSVDYRLAPEHPFPAGVEDACAATQWVAEHAAELGGDPARLAVAGDSAGGNISAIVARRARDAGGPPLRFQLLIYPATDLSRSMPSHTENGEGYLLTTESINWFMNHYIPEGNDLRQPDLSPLFCADLAGLPPALVITAEFDPLRDEGEAYAAKLREAGVDATASRYDGMIHAFFGMDALFDGSKKATDEAVRALQDALT